MDLVAGLCLSWATLYNVLAQKFGVEFLEFEVLCKGVVPLARSST